MKRARVWLGVFMVLAVSHALQGKPADPGQQLTKLIQQMEEREAAFRELSQQERSITRALSDLDDSLARLDQETARLDAATVREQKRIQEAELRAARMGSQLLAAEEVLARRLRSVLRLGPAADVQVMLGSHSLRDLIWRRAVLRRMAALDAQLVHDVTTKREALLAERQELIARKAQHAATRTELERARKATTAARQNRAQLLNQVALQKSAVQQQLIEMTAAKRRLTELMEDLPVSPDATGFAALRGNLPWPTQGQLTIPFGPFVDPNTGMETHQTGITITAPLGQKVMAVSAGKVVHAGWIRGFGQLLIMDHGDGFHSLLAHLSRINVETGDAVAEGDVVAFVGDSESASGPCLYFELRNKGRPVNPLKWLKR